MNMWSYSLPTIQQNMSIPALAVGTLVVLVAALTFVQLAPASPSSSMTNQAKVVVSDDVAPALEAVPVVPELPIISADEANVPVDTKVTVNGQDVPVPPSGSVQQTVESPGGTTSFNISVDSNVTGDSTVQSSNSVTFNLQTTSEVTTDNTE